MSKKVLERGVVDQTFYVMLRDSGTNLGKQALTTSTSGLQAYYVRDRATPATSALQSLASATAAHTDWGFIEVQSSGMRGMYRFDSPDAPFAVGSSGVVFQIGGATGLLDTAWEIELVDPITSSNPIPAQTVSFSVGAKADLQDRLNEYGAVRPTVSGRQALLAAGGHIGVDWANVSGPTTSGIVLSGTTINTVGEISTSGAQAVADHTLRRGLGGNEGSLDSRSLGWGVQKLVNRLAVAGTTLSVYRTNDTTVSWTQTVTTSGGAAPIIEANTD